MTEETAGPSLRSGRPTIPHLLRELAPQVLGVLSRKHGDFEAVEDAVQDALIAAAEQWPSSMPSNPRGWLYHVATRRLTDHIRSEMARKKREDAVASALWAEWAFVPPPSVDVGIDEDDTLALLFMCCHPSLTPSSAVALTLRAVGGLTTAEIAAAFLVPEATMAQRISRAKATIKGSNIPFALPPENEWRQRIESVTHVLYLMFNEGYTSSSGDRLTRIDLSGESIRLTRLLHRLAPADAEVAGLLALMLLTDARRPARTGPHGELIPLDEQDRSLWSDDMIEEGAAILTRTLNRDTVGPYQIQAAIAAVHDEARRASDTDWRQIAGLYRVLEKLADNPMVTLSRAIAVAMVEGPHAGLAMLERLDTDPRTSGHYRLDAVRGHLYERLGESDRAVAHYQAAATRTLSIPERDYLLTKAARLAAPTADPSLRSG